MITRREVFLGGSLTIVWGCGCAHGQTQSFYHGCSISDAEVKDKVGPSPSSFSFNIETDQIQNGSGDRTFDQALARTLSKLTDLFSVLPGFAFFDDATSYNAFASSSKRLGRTDGSVVFGKKLFRDLIARPDHPELGVAAVCAHEFGHITQYKLGIPQRLVGPDRRVKRLELHADFLAGYFAGNRKLESSNFPAAVFAATQFSFGDNSFGSPQHHGTGTERANAVVAGFKAAYEDKLDFSPAVEKGIQLVLSLPG